MRSPGRHPAAGFTLLEMLVVMALLGLAMTLVLPRLGSGGPAVQVRGAARDLAAAARAAQLDALTRNRVVDLTVDAAGVHRDGRRLREFPTGLRLDLPGSEARSLALRFYPDGSSSGGAVDLALGPRRYTVAVDWLTGTARVQEAGDARP